MNKWLEILLGLILVIAPIYLAWGMQWHNLGIAAVQFLKGGVVWMVILVGLLFVMLGISDLKG